MENNLLSIIIPVFNTDKYLKKCFDSILLQMVNGIDIIVIDDGSTDSSPSICDEYAKKYGNFLVIHEFNHGQSFARNVGLERAKGDYIFFIDSDDFLENGCLSMIIDKIQSNADIYEIGFRVIRSGKKERIQYPIISEQKMNSCEYLKQTIKQYNYEWYPWKYIFNRNFFNKLGFRFPQGMYYEDVFLIPRIILSSTYVQPINLIGYNYILGRPGATTHGIKIKNECDKLTIIESNILFCQKLEDNELKRMLCDNFSKMYYSSLIVLYAIKNKVDRDRFLEELRSKRYLVKYTNSFPQLIIKCMISFLGLKNTALVLYYRMVFKK